MSCIECVICSELMTAECVLVHLDCGHVFHEPCIDGWFQNSRTCPSCCRGEMTSHRLYLEFTANPHLTAMQEQVKLKEAEVESLKDTIRVDRIRMEELCSEKTQLNLEIADCRAQLVKFKEMTFTLFDSYRQKSAGILSGIEERANADRNWNEIKASEVPERETSMEDTNSNAKVENVFMRFIDCALHDLQFFSKKIANSESRERDMVEEIADLKAQLKNADSRRDEIIDDQQNASLPNDSGHSQSTEVESEATDETENGDDSSELCAQRMVSVG